MDDRELLRCYTQSGNEDAFTKLVERYLGMVYGTAFRRTGNRELAEEVSQNVFALLARKATQLKPGAVIAGWLHRTTVLQSSHTMRSERTRTHKMKAFSESLSEDIAEAQHEWNEVAHIIDASMNKLQPADRDVLFLRFFEGWTYRDIGHRFGKSESATQRHVTRAVEKLSHLLKKKGVTISSTALAAGLGPELTQAAPAGLAATVSQTALSSVSVTASTGILTNLLLFMSQTKTSTLILAGCGLIVLCTGGGILLGKRHHPSSDVTNRSSGTPEAMVSSTPVEATPAPQESTPPSLVGAPDNGVAALLQEAVALLEKAATPKSVENDVRGIVSQLTTSDMPEALRFASNVSLDEEAGNLLREEIYRRWGALDGTEAVSAALAVADRSERQDNVRKVINGWAESDPEAAYRWHTDSLDTVTDAIGERAYQDLIGGIGKGWIRYDLEAGFAFVESLPLDTQNVVLREFGDFANDPATHEAVATKIASLEDSEMRGQMIQHFGGKWGKVAPREMARWFDSIAYDSPASQFQSSNSLGEAYFQQHPREAVDWFYAKIPEPVKPDFIRGIVAGEWAERDPAAARAWLVEHGFDPNTLLDQ